MEQKKHEELFQEAKNFFDATKKKIGESIREKENIVQLSFTDLAKFSTILSDRILESPEECDLGNPNIITGGLNGVSGFGCSVTCELVAVTPDTPGVCGEGLRLCNDGTCSADCSVTDEGDDSDPICETGLSLCVADNNLCYDPISDGYCHSAVSSCDPDCPGASICA